MSRVAHLLQAIARHEIAARPACELAVVTSVFDTTDDGDDGQSVSLKLKDSGLPIPRVPVASALTGAAALPRVGDVVVVLFPRGTTPIGRTRRTERAASAGWGCGRTRCHGFGP